MLTLQQHPDLDTALRAARRAARPILKEQEGGKRRTAGYDREENHWYFARTERVMEEAARLFREHGLELEWEDTDLTDKGVVVTRWALVHTATGQRRPYRWVAPIAPVESETLGVAWTTRHAQRWVTILVLQLDLIEEARPGDIVERGFVVRRATSPADVERVELDTIVGEAPGWMDAGLPDPGRLPGEDESADEQLAAEADAAARGEVVEVPDAAQLWRASQAWRGREGKSEADLRAAACVPAPGRPLTDDDRRALRVFLERERCWP